MKRSMNRSINHLAVFLMLVFAALFVQLNLIQAFRSEELNTRTGNSRPVDLAFSKPRGTVLTADGVILSRSVPVDTRKKFQREFPEGERYAEITGHFNYSFGATGLESAYNEELAGTRTDQKVRTFEDLVKERDSSGNLHLTVRSDLQRAAIEALGDRRGSVVALEPATGGVLALWSWPTYDPNLLSTHDQDAAAKAKAFLEAADGNPMLPRTYRETYAPGSTFKVVTAATGVETGEVTPEEPVYPTETSFTPPQTQRPLPNYGGSSCGGTLFTVLARSCNTSLARMGLDIGGPAMIAGSEAFGFNQRPPFDLPAVASVFPDEDYSHQLPFLAQSAIGQQSVTSTPLQMALVAAGIANEGRVMAPHVVDRITDQDNELIRRIEPKVWKEAISPGSAAIMREAMHRVVTEGTASSLRIDGLEVGAKTGTAQTGENRSHAWMIAWATRPGESQPFIAVAVVVLDQSGVGEGTGNGTAGPVARRMIEAALQPMPDPPTEMPSTEAPQSPVETEGNGG